MIAHKYFKQVIKNDKQTWFITSSPLRGNFLLRMHRITYCYRLGFEEVNTVRSSSLLLGMWRSQPKSASVGCISYAKSAGCGFVAQSQLQLQSSTSSAGATAICTAIQSNFCCNMTNIHNGRDLFWQQFGKLPSATLLNSLNSVRS